MSGDSRKDFVLSSISAFFGYSVSDGAVSHVLDCGELNRFLDDPGCPLLAARVELSHGIRLVQAYNNVSVEETDRAALDSWLLFFKLEPCAITPDNIHRQRVRVLAEGFASGSARYSVWGELEQRSPILLGRA